MKQSFTLPRVRAAMPLVLALSTLALADCATQREAPQQFAAAEHLRPSGDPERPMQYRAPGANLSRYKVVLVDPVALYFGPDAQFGKDITADDRDQIARYMQETFSKALGKEFIVVSTPGPSTLRLRLTLTGLEANKPVRAGISHIAPIGVVVNAAKEAAGSNGTGFGSVSYAVQLSDAQTGEVLYEYVTRQNPHALDVTSAFGRLAGAKTGIDVGASLLVADLTSQVSCAGHCQVSGF